MRRALVYVAIATTLLFGTPAAGRVPGQASTPPLSTATPLIRWEGQPAGSSLAPVEDCRTSPCSEFPFSVDIPSGHWTRSRGGVEISIRWPTPFVDLDLYVVEGSTIVGSSEGPFSSAEGVVIPEMPSGDYEAVVVARTDDPPAFEGILQIEDSREPAPTRALLPNLRPLKPTDLRISSLRSDGFQPSDPYGDEEHFSCYRSETEDTGAERCLRFTTTTVNEGTGAFRLRVGSQQEGNLYPTYQVIEHADGTTSERWAGSYEFHDEHGHFHYERFVRHQLYRVKGPERERVGRPRRGLKVGFCIIDGLNHRWAREGSSSREFQWPCNGVPPGETRDSGISPGWGDRYDWYFVDQYVDITGIPDGTYELEITSDFSQTIRESNEKDNKVSVFIRIFEDGVRVLKN